MRGNFTGKVKKTLAAVMTGIMVLTTAFAPAISGITTYADEVAYKDAAVILDHTGNYQYYETLAEAVENAIDGDLIEVKGTTAGVTGIDKLIVITTATFPGAKIVGTIGAAEGYTVVVNDQTTYRDGIGEVTGKEYIIRVSDFDVTFNWKETGKRDADGVKVMACDAVIVNKSNPVEKEIVPADVTVETTATAELVGETIWTATATAADGTVYTDIYWEAGLLGHNWKYVEGSLAWTNSYTAAYNGVRYATIKLQCQDANCGKEVEVLVVPAQDGDKIAASCISREYTMFYVGDYTFPDGTTVKVDAAIALENTDPDGAIDVNAHNTFSPVTDIEYKTAKGKWSTKPEDANADGVTITYRPVYTCPDCGRNFYGDEATKDLTQTDYDCGCIKLSGTVSVTYAVELYKSEVYSETVTLYDDSDAEHPFEDADDKLLGATPATCTENAVFTYECQYCGQAYDVELEDTALGHQIPTSVMLPALAKSVEAPTLRTTGIYAVKGKNGVLQYYVVNDVDNTPYVSPEEALAVADDEDEQVAFAHIDSAKLKTEKTKCISTYGLKYFICADCGEKVFVEEVEDTVVLVEEGYYYDETFLLPVEEDAEILEATTTDGDTVNYVIVEGEGEAVDIPVTIDEDATADNIAYLGDNGVIYDDYDGNDDEIGIFVVDDGVIVPVKEITQNVYVDDDGIYYDESEVMFDEDGNAFVEGDGEAVKTRCLVYYTEEQSEVQVVGLQAVEEEEIEWNHPEWAYFEYAGAMETVKVNGKTVNRVVITTTETCKVCGATRIVNYHEATIEEAGADDDIVCVIDGDGNVTIDVYGIPYDLDYTAATCKKVSKSIYTLNPIESETMDTLREEYDVDVERSLTYVVEGTELADHKWKVADGAVSAFTEDGTFSTIEMVCSVCKAQDYISAPTIREVLADGEDAGLGKVEYTSIFDGATYRVYDLSLIKAIDVINAKKAYVTFRDNTGCEVNTNPVTGDPFKLIMPETIVAGINTVSVVPNPIYNTMRDIYGNNDIDAVVNSATKKFFTNLTYDDIAILGTNDINAQLGELVYDGQDHEVKFNLLAAPGNPQWSIDSYKRVITYAVVKADRNGNFADPGDYTNKLVETAAIVKDAGSYCIYYQKDNYGPIEVLAYVTISPRAIDIEIGDIVGAPVTWLSGTYAFDTEGNATSGNNVPYHGWIKTYTMEAGQDLAEVLPAIETVIASGSVAEGEDLGLVYTSLESDQPGTYLVSTKYDTSVAKNYVIDNDTVAVIVYAKGEEAPEILYFDDVQDPEEYYFEPVYWAVANDITWGYNDNTFRPDGVVTRKEMALFLWRLAGRPEATITESPFSDLNGLNGVGTEGYKAVLWAAEAGIVYGYTDGTFRPNDQVIRKDAMIMIYRAFGRPAVNGTTGFSDVDGTYNVEKNPDTYRSILWAKENGITEGYTNGVFGVSEGCARKDVVTFMFRAAND